MYTVTDSVLFVIFPGEKPFSCPHCNRAFADRSNLRAHLQTHSDVKKYQCKNCSKTFSRMSLLHKHEESGCCVAHWTGILFSTSGEKKKKNEETVAVAYSSSVVKWWRTVRKPQRQTLKKQKFLQLVNFMETPLCLFLWLQSGLTPLSTLVLTYLCYPCTIIYCQCYFPAFSSVSTLLLYKSQQVYQRVPFFKW